MSVRERLEIDRYGFILGHYTPGKRTNLKLTISNDVGTVPIYIEKEFEVSAHSKRCMKSWQEMVGNNNNGRWEDIIRNHPNKLKRELRKGIPHAIRGSVYFLLSGNFSLLLITSIKAVAIKVEEN